MLIIVTDILMIPTVKNLIFSIIILNMKMLQESFNILGSNIQIDCAV